MDHNRWWSANLKIMDYTKKNGEFYKVILDGKILTFGKLEPETVISTVHEVIFITEKEYNVLNKDYI